MIYPAEERQLIDFLNDLDTDLYEYIKYGGCSKAKGTARSLREECRQWIDRLRFEGIGSVLERGKHEAVV